MSEKMIRMHKAMSYIEKCQHRNARKAKKFDRFVRGFFSFSVGCFAMSIIAVAAALV